MLTPLLWISIPASDSVLVGSERVIFISSKSILYKHKVSSKSIHYEHIFSSKSILAPKKWILGLGIELGIHTQTQTKT